MSVNGERNTTFLPDGMADMLKRRAIELAGILLIALALAYLAALLTFDARDPSLNTASGGGARNLLGLPGAIVADLALQWLGWASALGAPILAAWGWRLVADRVLARAGWRAVLALVALVVSALALGTLEAVGASGTLALAGPTPAGAGGVIGTLGVQHGTTLLPHLPMGWTALGLGVLGLGLTLFVMGITLGEWLSLGRRTVGGVGATHGAVRGAVREAGGLVPAMRGLVGRGDGRVEPALSRPDLNRPAKSARPRTPPRPAPEARPTRADRVETPTKTAPAKRAAADRQRKLDLPPTDGAFYLPTLDLLEDVEVDAAAQSQNREGLEQNARMLEGVLEDFGIKGEIVKVRPGPVVTLYELEPAPGTKTSRVIGLADDIARSMSAISVRIATVPGRSVIGIELPNARREMVGLRELLGSTTYDGSKAKLPMVLGKDIGGAPEIADLAGMPHLLVAGTTGSGKSVGLNAMILSLLYKLTPDQCRFIMIDPKMLELSVYDDIPHLLSPVVTDPKKAVVALKWTVREMEDRYRAMSKLSVRNIEGYNKRVTDAAKKGEVINRTVQTGFDPDTGKPIFEEEPLDLTPMPYIVVIVDEMADLMLVAGKEIEASIQRLAQMARAAGIHLIMATQRPSVDVITGTIKANFPTRISFMVTSKIDSRTILGEQGAEQLLGKGDMLYMAGGGRITRIHGPFVDDSEVEAVCGYLRHQGEPDYLDAVTDEDDMTGGFDTDVSGASQSFGGSGGGGGGDESLYDQAVALVAREGKCSTSFIQRHLQIGYNRAARIVEQMEKEGVVSAANHVGKRAVLVGDHSA
ncbi:DNA translocase FtsK 4TM domain-containing protein [Marivibrio halodurans]|uniref:DNA translocase FtsK n=1 Tax=Marivibrio halodurans TaxID=2039722 RepID=A0A8J7S789_9PROT|nr:DNA translocase FtsK 4TM domain-containing protein [Marivibrio halodurans]MBP5858114.1 DNA translocase FtsK 4TM domain-containing protein [Marivibrio halodurans]